MTPMHGRIIVQCSVSSIWHLSPKTRYYLYRSVWNKEAETLHILPHWNWEGREGEKTPVFVYTNYPSAELFINGKSYGRQTKHKNGTVENRYRLMWHDAVYQPGEVRVVAYDERGESCCRKDCSYCRQAASYRTCYRSQLSSVQLPLCLQVKDNNHLLFMTM